MQTVTAEAIKAKHSMIQNFWTDTRNTMLPSCVIVFFKCSERQRRSGKADSAECSEEKIKKTKQKKTLFVIISEVDLLRQIENCESLFPILI